MPARFLSSHIRQLPDNEVTTYTMRVHGFLCRQDAVSNDVPYDSGHYEIVTNEELLAQIGADGRSRNTNRDIFVYRDCPRCRRYSTGGVCGPLHLGDGFEFCLPDGNPLARICRHITWPYCCCNPEATT